MIDLSEMCGAVGTLRDRGLLLPREPGADESKPDRFYEFVNSGQNLFRLALRRRETLERGEEALGRSHRRIRCVAMAAEPKRRRCVIAVNAQQQRQR